MSLCCLLLSSTFDSMTTILFYESLVVIAASLNADGSIHLLAVASVFAAVKCDLVIAVFILEVAPRRSSIGNGCYVS